MAFTIYDAAIPPMLRMLQNLSNILDKAVAQAKEKDMPASALLDARLAPDMHPLPRQIQMASDAAKGCAARLAGIDVPAMPDEEKTFAELQQRLAKTITFLKSVKPEQMDGAEERTIIIKTPSRDFEMSGRDFVTGFAMPNFLFHVTTAYAILRHKGIAIGKMDYLGGV